MKVKALSLWQPWASAIALGLKRVETRSWGTEYRGPLAIHAAQKNDFRLRFAFDALCDVKGIGDVFHQAGYRTFQDLPLGAIVAVGRVVDCQLTQSLLERVSNMERMLGNYALNRHGLILDEVRALPETIRCRGHQGFFWVEMSTDYTDFTDGKGTL